MERPYWKKDQLLEELRNVSVDDLLVHGVSLLQNSSVLCFAHGNLNQSMVTLMYMYTYVCMCMHFCQCVCVCAETT